MLDLSVTNCSLSKRSYLMKAFMQRLSVINYYKKKIVVPQNLFCRYQ